MQSSSNEAGDGDGTPSCMEYFARVEREATNPKCVECKMVTKNHRCTFICDGGAECGAPVCTICKYDLFKKEMNDPTRCSKHSFTYDTDSSSGLPSPRRLQDSNLYVGNFLSGHGILPKPPPPIANSQLPSEANSQRPVEDARPAEVAIRKSPRNRNSGARDTARDTATRPTTKKQKLQQICSHCQKNPTPKICTHETIDIPNLIYEICKKPICTSCKMLISGPMGKYLCSEHAALYAGDSDEDVVDGATNKPPRKQQRKRNIPPTKQLHTKKPPAKKPVKNRTPPTRVSPRKNTTSTNNSSQVQSSSELPIIHHCEKVSSKCSFAKIFPIRKD